MKRELLCCLMLLTLFSCSKTTIDEIQVKKSTVVRIDKLQQVEDQMTVAASGTVASPDAPSMLGFLVSGKVIRVDAREGEYVKTGQRLALLDLTDYELGHNIAFAQAEAAKIAYERAEDEHRRMLMLFESKSLAPNDYQKYRAAYKAAGQQYNQAVASEKLARKHLADATLCSPVDGYISKRTIEPGETVGPGRPVFEIVKLDTVEVGVGIPETDVHLVRIGQKAGITLSALPGESFEGTVNLVNVSADPNTRTFKVRISVPNPKHALKIGMVVDVKISGDMPVKRLIMPVEAIVRDPQGASIVYAYFPDQKRVYAKRIEIGDLFGRAIEIRGGLTGNESIVIAGQEHLKDGAIVSVETAEAAEKEDAK